VIRADEFGEWDWRQRRTEPDLSWHRISRGRIDVMDVPGTHLTILEGETARGLAAVLARAVDTRLASCRPERTTGDDLVVDLRNRSARGGRRRNGPPAIAR
jgi:hypothetical protein